MPWGSARAAAAAEPTDQARIMKHLTPLALAAGLLALTLAGCVVAPATTSTTVTKTESGITTTTVTTTVAPPPLPVYEQPAVPGPRYLWTPGYWAWGDAAYYWVPGVWVLPPRVGLLWTPGWWGWSGGSYRWHLGYWGPPIGFYGGINYGFGYFGTGYVGGYWHGGEFHYNRSVNNIRDKRITNVYVQNITRNTTINRVSYNGGSGGTTVQPTTTERAALQQPHVAPTTEQMRQHAMAVGEHGQRYRPSGDGPAVYGSSRVSERFNDPGAVRAPAPDHAQTPLLPMTGQEAAAAHAAPGRVEERAAPEERRGGPAERESAQGVPAGREQIRREQAQRRQPPGTQRARPARQAQHPRPAHREREHEER